MRQPVERERVPPGVPLSRSRDGVVLQHGAWRGRAADAGERAAYVKRLLAAAMDQCEDWRKWLVVGPQTQSTALMLQGAACNKVGGNSGRTKSQGSVFGRGVNR